LRCPRWTLLVVSRFADGFSVTRFRRVPLIDVFRFRAYRSGSLETFLNSRTIRIVKPVLSKFR
jgi:hypothetical protein